MIYDYLQSLTKWEKCHFKVFPMKRYISHTKYCTLANGCCDGLNASSSIHLLNLMHVSDNTLKRTSGRENKFLYCIKGIYLTRLMYNTSLPPEWTYVGLIQWGRGKRVGNSQITFPNWFSCMRTSVLYTNFTEMCFQDFVSFKNKPIFFQIVDRCKQATSHHLNQKNIVRHTTHTIVSWPNPKQWLMIHTSGLMMIIR